MAALLYFSTLYFSRDIYEYLHPIGVGEKVAEMLDRQWSDAVNNIDDK